MRDSDDQHQRRAAAGATVMRASDRDDDRDEGQRMQFGGWCEGLVSHRIRLPCDHAGVAVVSYRVRSRHALPPSATTGVGTARWRGRLGRLLVSTTPQLQGTDPVAVASTRWRGRL
jgi:hypothetical protein